jgi:hypothetical protein
MFTQVNLNVEDELIASKPDKINWNREATSQSIEVLVWKEGPSVRRLCLMTYVINQNIKKRDTYQAGAVRETLETRWQSDRSRRFSASDFSMLQVAYSLLVFSRSDTQFRVPIFHLAPYKCRKVCRLTDRWRSYLYKCCSVQANRQLAVRFGTTMQWRRHHAGVNWFSLRTHATVQDQASV